MNPNTNTIYSIDYSGSRKIGIIYLMEFTTNYQYIAVLQSTILTCVMRTLPGSSGVWSLGKAIGGSTGHYESHLVDEPGSTTGSS